MPALETSAEDLAALMTQATCPTTPPRTSSEDRPLTRSSFFSSSSFQSLRPWSSLPTKATFFSARGAFVCGRPVWRRAPDLRPEAGW